MFGKSSAGKWIGLCAVGFAVAAWGAWQAGIGSADCPICRTFAPQSSVHAAAFEPGAKDAGAPAAPTAGDAAAGNTSGDASPTAAGAGKNAGGNDMTSSAHMATKTNLETAVFAAGCFWGVQVTFDKVPGVASTEVGYCNGKTKNPTYKDVCNHDTGHAEVVRVRFDPTKVSFEQLVDVFFDAHNPTQVNRQGPDIGDQYRSAIFYTSDAQKASAEKRKKAWQPRFGRPIATEITAAAEFYTAEDYHQKYLAKRGVSECHLPQYAKGDLVTPRPEIEPPAAPTPAAGASADAKSDTVVKSEAEWKKILTPEQFEVLRNKGTERAFTGKYWNTKTDGTYVCAGCGAELFTSADKFDSGCGWPSFDKAVVEGRIKENVDTSHGMVRTEVVCARCGGHLGHLFDDGPTKTGMRYCINSVSIELKEKEGAAKQDEGKK